MIIIPTEKGIDWKKPPIALLSIILINILVFFLYQSLDQHRFQMAFESYQKNELLQTEWLSYKTYRAKSNQPRITLTKENEERITFELLYDAGFTEFLKENAKHIILPENYARWEMQRTSFNSSWSLLSGEAFGLKPIFLKPLTLITYQFLHGDSWHLISNMVLLLLVGFAAEAALGSLRFTFYYLLTGVGSGLIYSIIELNTGSGIQSLVGASGSISGVMAIYLGLFRLQKIEFFYWFAIFTGYFRTSALMIFPLFIGKELFFYFSNDGSNVAYTAHFGGFVTGLILILLTQKLNATAINDDYLDSSEESNDPYLISLDSVYKLIGKCEFTQAWNELTTLINKHGNNAQLIEIQLNLLKAIDTQKVSQFLLGKLGQSYSNTRIITSQLKCWNSLDDEQKQLITFHKKHQFVGDLIYCNQMNQAIDIYKNLKGLYSKDHPEEIAVLAQKIATFYQQHSQPKAFNTYSKEAQDLMASTVNGARI